MDDQIRRPTRHAIPPIIKRNTALITLAHSFVGSGMQFAYGLGPLMVLALTGSTSLAGLSVAIIGLSRFAVAYPVGRITDKYGRKPGVLLGCSIAFVGTLLVGIGMLLRDPVLFSVGLLVFAMGMSAAQQLRVAVTDMFPPSQRGEALGYIAIGPLIGLLISPAMISLGEILGLRIGWEPLAMPWLLLPLLIIPGMMLITLVKPDPKHIGMNLQAYYPGYVPAHRRGGSASYADFHPIDLLRKVPTRLAIISNAAAQGNMSIVMVLTSLVLHDHGHSLSAIAVSHMFHTAGMFAFTIPLGRLADRVGRERVMYPGVAVALLGAVMVTFLSNYWLITIGTFLVGIGWAAANVSATAMMADHSETIHRGRAIGLTDTFAAISSVISALITGPIITYYGLPGAGVAAALFAVVPFLLLALSGREGWQPIFARTRM
ncbi:MAG: hypothetical protein RLZ98_1567 [Pseudomonadota bacterium]|jgi:MFS family permease